MFFATNAAPLIEIHGRNEPINIQCSVFVEHPVRESVKLCNCDLDLKATRIRIEMWDSARTRKQFGELYEFAPDFAQPRNQMPFKAIAIIFIVFIR